MNPSRMGLVPKKIAHKDGKNVTHWVKPEGERLTELVARHAADYARANTAVLAAQARRVVREHIAHAERSGAPRHRLAEARNHFAARQFMRAIRVLHPLHWGSYKEVPRPTPPPPGRRQVPVTKTVGGRRQRFLVDPKHLVAKEEPQDKDLYAWAQARGAGPAEIKQIEARIREVFGKPVPLSAFHQAFSAPGLETRLLTLRATHEMDDEGVEHPALYIGMHLHDPVTGGKVGDLSRTFSLHGAEVHVHHDYFALEESHQGTGFAKNLLKNSFAFYEQHGVTEAHLQAGLDKGKYTWAALGFKANPDDFPRQHARFVSYVAQEVGEEPVHKEAAIEHWRNAEDARMSFYGAHLLGGGAKAHEVVQGLQATLRELGAPAHILRESKKYLQQGGAEAEALHVLHPNNWISDALHQKLQGVTDMQKMADFEHNGMRLGEAYLLSRESNSWSGHLPIKRGDPNYERCLARLDKPPRKKAR